jgi:hypothetical protein
MNAIDTNKLTKRNAATVLRRTAAKLDHGRKLLGVRWSEIPEADRNES